MQGVTVREATAADIDGLVASITALFAEDSVRDRLRNPGWPEADGAHDETENLANPDVLSLLAERAGSVIGHLTGSYHAATTMWTEPRAVLVSMHVMAGYRGQHVGAQLVEYFKSWAKEKGAVQLRVTAYTANTGAISFYHRQGFAPLETPWPPTSRASHRQSWPG
jgi:GNAT superfamily N-acetyltransferase